jgi:hypothetical protein
MNNLEVNGEARFLKKVCAIPEGNLNEDFELN